MEYKSKINTKIMVVENWGRKVIFVNGAEQTGGTITGMWQKALLPLKRNIRNIKSVCLLGIGGGDVIRFIQKLNKKIKITAVDLDPAMIQIAGDYFGIVNSETLKIIQSDALEFLETNNKKFDLIIIDLFIGFKNPEKFRNSKFLSLVNKTLSDDGFSIYNSHYQEEKDPEFKKFSVNCLSVFTEVKVIVSYPYSRILLLR